MLLVVLFAGLVLLHGDCHAELCSDLYFIASLAFISLSLSLPLPVPLSVSLLLPGACLIARITTLTLTSLNKLTCSGFPFFCSLGEIVGGQREAATAASAGLFAASQLECEQEG